MLSRPLAGIGLRRAHDRVLASRPLSRSRTVTTTPSATSPLVAARLDHDRVVAQLAQPEDLRLQVRLRVLRVVVLRVLAQVAPLARGSIRSAIARRPSVSSPLQLGLERGEAVGEMWWLVSSSAISGCG